MTTNQTIDGVPRELLTDLAGYGESGKVPEPWMVERLRALLLDAEQLAPVAVVLPQKLKSPAFKTVDRGSVNYAAGWNAYANELKRLNPSL